MVQKRTEDGKQIKGITIINASLQGNSCQEMKVKALVAFKTKLSTPYRKILLLLGLKKPPYIKSRRPQSTHDSAEKHHQKCLSFPVFRTRRKSKEMKRVREARSASEAGREMQITTVPPGPSSVAKGVHLGVKTDAVVEEACRSFEKYLLEMIVEEGNVRDLMDVEELLYCWKNLKSPVFAELVSRFYGELCKDLFSPEES